jgi:quercetin dioxygenase-like cupin family protein
VNDDFEGGETEFLYQNRREEAVAGDVLIFPAGFTHTHRGNPPIGGHKYLITSWGYMQG